MITLKVFDPTTDERVGTVINGDCLDILKKFPDNYVDSIVTDPPYEIGFMGKSHDRTGIAYSVDMWAECLRVLKPGGHLLSFGAPKTYHRMACAVEDAGFEIRDSLHWVFGSGFPKSMNVSKAVESTLLNGSSHTRALRKTEQEGGGEPYTLTGKNNGILGETRVYDRKTFAASTDEAQQWEGWGTALKPAVEPIVVARKPLEEKTVAKNVLKHGTGALNIDGTRVGTTDKLGGGDQSGKTKAKVEGWDRPWMQDPEAKAAHAERVNENVAKAEALGRWPANLILGHSEECERVRVESDEFSRNTTEEWTGFGQKEKPDYESEKIITSREVWTCVEGCPVADVDRQSGVSATRAGGSAGESAYLGRTAGNPPPPRTGFSDKGGASRFFHTFQMESPLIYQAKANKKERPTVDGTGHSTVKPLALIRNLVRLVTPPGGIVLDPFGGSGTTGEAALMENRKFILIEKEESYIPLINVRLDRNDCRVES